MQRLVGAFNSLEHSAEAEFNAITEPLREREGNGLTGEIFLEGWVEKQAEHGRS